MNKYSSGRLIRYWITPTDVASAPDPTWHYVIVGLKREAPEVRSYRVVDGRVTSEPLSIV